MTSGRLKAALTALFLFFQTACIFAQTANTLHVAASIPPVQRLRVYPAQHFPPVTKRAFDRGYIEIEQAVIITVSSNVPWKITIHTSKSNLYITPGVFKPVADFQWRVEGEYLPLTGMKQTVYRGKAGVRDMQVMCDYRLLVNWKDTPPGEWRFDPVFTIEPDYGADH